MIKFKLNGIDVQCDNAAEAQQILMGSLKASKTIVNSVNTEVDLKVSRATTKGTQKLRRKLSLGKIYRWTPEEVNWIFENRHQPTAYAQNNGDLRKRHSAKAIGIMIHKLRNNKTDDLSKELRQYIPSLPGYQASKARRSLLDPIS
jgi:hypothetical protein